MSEISLIVEAHLILLQFRTEFDFKGPVLGDLRLAVVWSHCSLVWLCAISNHTGKVSHLFIG